VEILSAIILEPQAAAFDDKQWNDIDCRTRQHPYVAAPPVYVGYGWYSEALRCAGEVGPEAAVSIIRRSVSGRGDFRQRTGVANIRGGTRDSHWKSSRGEDGGNVVAVRLNNKWNPRSAPRVRASMFSAAAFTAMCGCRD